MDSKFIWLALVGILNSVVSLYYYARVLKNMYLREAPNGDESPIHFSAMTVVTVILFIIPNILLCFYFQPFLSFAQRSVAILLPGM